MSYKPNHTNAEGKSDWKDYPDVSTRVFASDLNHIEDGIAEVSKGLEDVHPTNEGTPGQVIKLDNNGKPVWGDEQGGGGGYVTKSEVQTMIDDAIGSVLEGSY